MRTQQNKSIGSRLPMGLAAILLLIVAQGCTTTPKQAFFTTPEDALDELVRAARGGDRARLDQIFGPDAGSLLDSGDPIADREAAENFIASIDDQYELRDMPNGSVHLLVGPNDFLFPIPIVLGEHGWVFDTKTGLDEVINRRVGRNEVDAVEVCKALVDAQREYLTLDSDGDGVLEYAQKLISDPGKKNGLYWPTGPGEPQSPIGELAAEAASEGYSRATTNPTPRLPRPYHGYRYRLLRAQGVNAEGGEIQYVIGDRMIAGFGIVAYPAEYRSSGVMTFITNQDGVVYERDLGPQTDSIAGTMMTFDPGPGWKRVSE